MNSRTDGSPLTASVTAMVVTGGTGTQAAGAGTLTHLGGGMWRYVPTAAETDDPVLAVQLNHTTGVNVTVTLLTTAANPADAVRLGLTALPNAGAEASGGLGTLSAAQASNGTLPANVHRWLTGTPNALVSGRVDASVGAIVSGIIAAGSFAANALDAVWAATTRVLTGATNLTTDLATPTNITAGTITTVTNLTNAATAGDLTAAMKTSVGSEVTNSLTTFFTSAAALVTGIWTATTRVLTGGTNISLAKGTGITGFADLDASGVRAAVGLATANLDTQLANGAGLTADAVLDAAVEGAVTLKESLRLANSVLGGKASGLATTTALFRDINDLKTRVTATVDSSGNRTAITTDLT